MEKYARSSHLTKNCGLLYTLEDKTTVDPDFMEI
jgi:hypothetical protein